jgi:hypothetical protein
VAIADRDLRWAQLAHVLARAVRESELQATDALRVLKHELRRRNTRQSTRIPCRSVAAQASIDKHAPDLPPNNNSPEALHADHVYAFTEDTLRTVITLDGWRDELQRLQTVVCVTAAENYRLQQLERAGTTGPAKYAAAGVRFTGPAPWSQPTA